MANLVVVRTDYMGSHKGTLLSGGDLSAVPAQAGELRDVGHEARRYLAFVVISGATQRYIKLKHKDQLHLDPQVFAFRCPFSLLPGHLPVADGPKCAYLCRPWDINALPKHASLDGYEPVVAVALSLEPFKLIHTKIDLS